MAEYVSPVGGEQTAPTVAPAYEPEPGPGLPAQAPLPDGQRKMQDLQSSGQYSAAQMAQMKNDAIGQMLRSGKYTPQQIEAYFGDSPADTSALHAATQANLQRNDQGQLSWTDAWHAGWDTSATAAAMDLASGRHFEGVTPAHMGVVDQTIAGTAALVGDAPFAVAGFFGGAYAGALGGAGAGAAVGGGPEDVPADVVGAVGGGAGGALFASGAAPQAMREVVTNIQRDHQNYSWQDVARDTAISTYNIAKSGAITLVGGKVGGAVAGKALDLGASQIVAQGAGAVAAGTTATTAAGALEGHMPTWQDYTAGAVTMLGFGLAMHSVAGGRTEPSEAGRRVAANLQTIYRQTGIDPTELTEAAKTDPQIRDEILGQDVHGDPSFARTRRLAPPEPRPYGREVPPAGHPEADAVISHAMGHMTRDEDMGLARELEGSADNAVSPKGAIGRYQIMPGTARQIMGASFDVHQLFNPKVNEYVARQVMTDLYKRFNGDTEAMLAAYNAGPGRGAQLQAAGPGTRLEAELDPSARATGGVRYTEVRASRDESFLPLETQRYLANARRRAGGPLPNSEGFGPPPEPPSAERADFLAPALAEGGAGEPPEPPEPPLLPGFSEGGDGEGPKFTGTTAQAYDAAREMIGEEKQSNDLLDVSKNLSQFFSELEPLRQIDTRLLAQDPTLNRNRDLMLEDMGRQTYGSDARAGVFVQRGIIDPMTMDIAKDSPSVRQAVEEAQKRGNLSDWTAYMVAKRVIDLENRGIKSGMDPTVAAKIVEDSKEQGKYEKATGTFNRVMDGALYYGRDSGLFSDSMVKSMQDKNPTFISFRRVMGDTSYGPGVKKFDPKNPLYKMEGSDRQIVEPLAATVDNIYQIVRNADRNRLIGAVLAAGKTMPELNLTKIADFSPSPNEATTAIEPYHQYWQSAEGPGLEYTAKQAAEDFAPLIAQQKRAGLGEREFMYFNEGKPEIWSTTDPMLARLLKGADSPGEADVVTKSLQWVASLQRAGIVSMLDYPARIALRHQITAFIADPYHPVPVVTWLRGAFHALGKDDEYWDWVAKGGAGVALADLDRNFLTDDIDQVFRDTGTYNAMWNTVQHPLAFAKIISERLDSAARIGYMKTLEDKGIDPIKAATMGRKAMLDYAERGTSQIANWMAKTTPFFRPHLLGLKQWGEALHDRPLSTVGAALAVVTLPTIALYALNRMQDPYLPEDRRFANLPEWQKTLGYVTPEIAGVRFHLPYPPQMGVPFGALATRFLDAQFAKDPHAFDGFAVAALLAILPPLPGSTVAQPLLETISNHDFFTGHSLIPAAQEKLSGPMQFTPNTTAPAKALARVLGNTAAPAILKSPIDIEHLVKGYTGGLGYTALRALNIPFNHSGEPWTVSDIPFVQSFVVRNPGMGSQPVQDFFADLDAYEQKHSDAAALLKRAGPNPEQALLQGIALQQSEQGDFKGAGMIDTAGRKVGRAMEEAASGGQGLIDEKLEQLRYARLVDRRNAIYMQERILQGVYQNATMSPDEKRQFTDRIYSDMIVTARDANRVLHEDARAAIAEMP